MPACPTRRGGSVSVRRVRRSRHLRAFRAAVLGFGVLLVVTAVRAGGIRMPSPGPQEQSAEERAITADPQRGIEHGVVLTLREVVAQPHGKPTVIGFRQRAKALSLEARGIGDIVVPWAGDRVELKRFWAFAVLPDGTVREITREDLSYRQEVEYRGRSIGSWRGVLPEITPGTVVEYGYVVMIHDYVVPQIEVTRRWPVLSGVFIWSPWLNERVAARWVFSRPTDIDAEVGVRQHVVVLTARNVPAMVDEPWGPPEVQRKAILRPFYQVLSHEDPGAYWKLKAKEALTFLRKFSRGRREIDSAIADMQIPQDADLETRLGLAYAWILKNIRNTSWRAGGGATEESEGKEVKDNARSVLRARRGTAWQIRWTWAAIAARLGARVGRVWVVDRRDYGVLNRQLMSMDQFARALVGVEFEEQGQRRFLVVDPGSMLPFGEIPWWFHGTEAILMRGGQEKIIRLNFTLPGRNTLATTGHVGFSDDGEFRRDEWRVEGGGQFVFGKRSLWRRREVDRKRLLRRRCGESETVEVLVAEAPGLDDPLEPWRLHCETEELLDPIDEGVDVYHVGIDGPWFMPVPDIGAPPRRTPVVFRFASNREDRIVIEPPAGFVAGALPEPVEVRSPHGAYRLVFERQDDGNVSFFRQFVLARPEVPASMFESLLEFLTVVREADTTTIQFIRQRREE